MDLETEGGITVEEEIATPVVKMSSAASAETVDTSASQEEQLVDTTTEGGLTVEEEPRQGRDAVRAQTVL